MARKLEQYVTAFLSWNVYCLHQLHSSFFFPPLFVLIESIFFQRKAAAANATAQQHALSKRPGKMSRSQTRWKHAWQLCVRTFNPPAEDVILSLDCHSLAGRTEDGGWWMVDGGCTTPVFPVEGNIFLEENSQIKPALTTIHIVGEGVGGSISNGIGQVIYKMAQAWVLYRSSEPYIWKEPRLGVSGLNVTSVAGALVSFPAS